MPSPEDEKQVNNLKKKYCRNGSKLVRYEKALTIFILITGMVVAIAAAYIEASEQTQTYLVFYLQSSSTSVASRYILFLTLRGR